MNNPLLEVSGLPRFNKILPKHVEPALKLTLTRNREELESLLIDLLDNHEKYKNSVKTSSLDINNNFKNLGTSSFIILKNLIES